MSVADGARASMVNSVIARELCVDQAECECGQCDENKRLAKGISFLALVAG